LNPAFIHYKNKTLDRTINNYFIDMLSDMPNYGFGGDSKVTYWISIYTAVGLFGGIHWNAIQHMKS
jgi:hypothetical protein